MTLGNDKLSVFGVRHTDCILWVSADEKAREFENINNNP